MLDWTQVLIVGVPAYIAALGGAIAAIIAAANRRAIHTAGGESIAQVAERTHDLAAVATLSSGGEPQAELAQVAERLNTDPASPIKVNGATIASIPPADD